MLLNTIQILTQVFNFLDPLFNFWIPYYKCQLDAAPDLKLYKAKQNLQNIFSLTTLDRLGSSFESEILDTPLVDGGRRRLDRHEKWNYSRVNMSRR